MKGIDGRCDGSRTVGGHGFAGMIVVVVSSVMLPGATTLLSAHSLERVVVVLAGLRLGGVW